MSAQCWCFNCAGRIVSRKTFISHGRKDKPDKPIQQQPLPLASMDDSDVLTVLEHDEIDFSSDDGTVNALGLGGEEEDDSRIGRGKLSASEVTLFLLDWMSTHKITDSATNGLWSLVQLLLPGEVDIPTFNQVKKILKDNEVKYVKRYDLCPNDCIVYFDSTYLHTKYKHSHRRACPECGANRYVVDPKDGLERAAKVFFFFPIAPYVRSLYSRPDLLPFLYTDSEKGVSEGHVKKSRGWARKMWDDPKLADDHRNLGLIGTTDGVPFFDDQKRGTLLYIYYKKSFVLIRIRT